jgi:hypothetical protein
VERKNEKRPERKEVGKATQERKKSGILNFIFGLFGNKKPVVKKSEIRPERKPERGDLQKRPERNSEPRRERPAPRNNQPIVRGGARKISSAKKTD